MLTRQQIESRIMVALDYPSAAEADKLMAQLDGISCWMKVGMQLFYAAGPGLIGSLKKRGYRVFLDLKLHDIPNTVKGASASIARLGADMFNVHAAGGAAMMASALEGVREAGGDPEQSGGGDGGPIVIAVTQLTSTSRVVMNEEIGIPGSVEEAVLRYARLAKQAGLHGVVASPLEAGAIKGACGNGFVTVTPGIRPAGSAAGDQARTATPSEALGGGSDYVVIGRPITAAADPRQAIESIIRSVLDEQ